MSIPRLLYLLLLVFFFVLVFLYFKPTEKTVEVIVVPSNNTYNETQFLASRANNFIVLDRPNKQDSSELPNVTLNPGMAVNPPGILPPFVGNYTHFVFSKKYNIAACVIPKVMSTILTGAMCYLQNSTEFVNAGRRIETEQYVGRFCKREIERYRPYVFERLYNKEKTFKYLTVVRNPIDRFLAAFTDKCYYQPKRLKNDELCQEVGCGDDLECFIKQMHKRLWGVMNGSHQMTVMDTHVVPMTWTCDMRKYLGKFKFYKYASKGSPDYTRFLDDFTEILREQGVPEDKINYIAHSLTTRNSPHATTGLSMRSKYEAFLKSRPDLLKILVDIYYFDYKIFDYPFPEGYNVSTRGSQNNKPGHLKSRDIIFHKKLKNMVLSEPILSSSVRMDYHFMYCSQQALSVSYTIDRFDIYTALTSVILSSSDCVNLFLSGLFRYSGN